MTPPNELDRHPLLIVADRASLRAYVVEFPPERPPFPRQVESVDMTATHHRLGEKVTDQAGAFPRGSAPDATSHAERQSINEEDERRAAREIGGHIAEILEEWTPSYWSFAAPSDARQPIMDSIPEQWLPRLRQEVASNLVNVPPQELSRHFSITRK